MATSGGDDRVDRDQTLVDYPAARSGLQQGAPSAPSSDGMSGGKIAGLVAGTLVAVAVIGAVLYFTVLAGGSDDAQSEYRGKVNAAMEDVVSANEELSDKLGALRSRRSPAAERAVDQAQSETSAARGAVNALTVPKGSERLAANARQTLSRQAAYLTAVKDALEDPRGGSAGQAQTLAGNLTDAFDVVAPADADWSQSISNAETLSAWARRTVRGSRRSGRRNAAAGAQSGGAATATPAPSSGSDCGGGLRAGPNTSCAFAANVRDAYNEAPGSAATVEVFSPTTGETYTMSCRPAGSGITCSGGNNASVSF